MKEVSEQGINKEGHKSWKRKEKKEDKKGCK